MNVLLLAYHGHLFMFIVMQSVMSYDTILSFFNSKQDCGGMSYGYPTISFYYYRVGDMIQVRNILHSLSDRRELLK